MGLTFPHYFQILLFYELCPPDTDGLYAPPNVHGLEIILRMDINLPICYVTTTNVCKSFTVPTFNSCTKCMGSPGIINDRTSDCHQSPGHGCIDDLTTERSFDSQATWVIDMLDLFFDVSSIDVSTTRH